MIRFLLTNDDGIDAPGLAALEQAAMPLGSCAIIAPRDGQSGCSHQVTVSRPLSVSEIASHRRHVDGTPADCVRLGLVHFHPEADWVLSGINSGGNLGADVHLSGTVAAVREAALFGKPGIAFSYYRTRDVEFDWPRIVPWVTSLVRDITTRVQEPRTFWNVNLPCTEPGEVMPAIVHCRTDCNPFDVRYRVEGDEFHYQGVYHARPRTAGSDIDVCFSGKIAVTLIRLP